MPKPMTDLELELFKARYLAQTLDLIFAAFDKPVTTHEQDVTCPLCGQRELRHTRDPKAPGAVMAVCNKCSER